MNIGPDISPREFWTLLAMRATGAAVVTTADGGAPFGFVALSATHFCAAPPLMSVAISETTSALEPLQRSRAFAINYLADNGLDVWERFSRRDAPKGVERFDGLDWHPGDAGAPILGSITGALECRLEETIERHRTILVLGRIVAAHHHPDRSPLVHFSGQVRPLR